MGISEYVKQEILSNFRHEPTDSQNNLFSMLSSCLTDGCESDLLLVSGYAGTGKTTAIAAFIRTLQKLGRKFVLLAPTGRSAKVLSYYTGCKAYTIHKQIYRQKSIRADGAIPSFSLDINKNRDTFFIVDECSLISNAGAGNSLFGTGALLDDLVDYVRAGSGNRMIFIGDPAQLPPVGSDCSPAMDPEHLSVYGEVLSCEMTEVVRQAQTSGILYNANLLRQLIMSGNATDFPKFELDGFEDIEKITGEFLIETLTDAIDRYGEDEVIVLCYSNRRANRYNMGIRAKVFYREEELVKGEKLMVVKNSYNFLDDIEELDFIANGDLVELQRIYNYTERYGLRFADAELSLPDYGGIEIKAKIILDTLSSEAPSLPYEQQNALFEGVMEDYSHIKSRRKRYEEVREDPYFTAMQVKYSAAITCHKSQGGQWDCVFIDRAFYNGEFSLEDKRWLYTALTRAKKKAYLVNFTDEFFK